MKHPMGEYNLSVSKLIVVIGLPGSGKSKYMEQIKAAGEVAAFYDDFQANAIQHDKNPRLSNHYSLLLKGLRGGQTIAVSDIRYCIKEELNVLIAAVIDGVPGIALDLRYFENNPEKCIKNVNTDTHRDVSGRLEKIKELSPMYKPPGISSTVLEVH